MMKFRDTFKLTDIFHLSMLTFYTFCAFLYFNSVNYSEILIPVNILVGLSIIILAVFASKMPLNRRFLLFRRIYMAPLVYFIYMQVQSYIKVINPYDYDNILIAWDRILFGADPTVWMHSISFPALTEFLQISYMTYFLAPLIHGIELHLKGDDQRFEYFAGVIIFSFYLSYMLYFFLPAIGPRFTLHDFGLTNIDLPGLFSAETLREFVNRGGGIVADATDPAAIVNRDCMPSGHTMITIVNLVLAFRFKSKFKWIFLVFGISLIFATVYLRYHYVVDLIAGITFALISLWVAPKLVRIFNKTR